MPQSSVIFGAITLAFLVFITQRGELRRYMGFVLGATQGAPVTSGGATANSAGSAGAQLQSQSDAQDTSDRKQAMEFAQAVAMFL